MNIFYLMTFVEKKIHEVTPLYSFESNGVAGRKKKDFKTND